MAWQNISQVIQHYLFRNSLVYRRTPLTQDVSVSVGYKDYFWDIISDTFDLIRMILENTKAPNMTGQPYFKENTKAPNMTALFQTELTSSING